MCFTGIENGKLIGTGSFANLNIPALPGLGNAGSFSDPSATPTAPDAATPTKPKTKAAGPGGSGVAINPMLTTPTASDAGNVASALLLGN